MDSNTFKPEYRAFDDLYLEREEKRLLSCLDGIPKDPKKWDERQHEDFCRYAAIRGLHEERGLNRRKDKIFSSTQAWVIVVSTVVLASCSLLELILKLSGMIK